MNDIYLTKRGLNQLRTIYDYIKACFLLRIDNACKIVTTFLLKDKTILGIHFYLIGSLCKLL